MTQNEIMNATVQEYSRMSEELTGQPMEEPGFNLGEKVTQENNEQHKEQEDDNYQKEKRSKIVGGSVSPNNNIVYDDFAAVL